MHRQEDCHTTSATPEVLRKVIRGGPQYPLLDCVLVGPRRLPLTAFGCFRHQLLLSCNTHIPNREIDRPSWVEEHKKDML
jgi:hypothetical protein